jgi:hypothetical protein
MPKELPPEIDAMLISSLSTGCPVREAARLAQVSVRTVYRRLASYQFRNCVLRTRWRDAEGSIGYLAHSSRQACERLVGLLHAKSEHVCLNAARSILTQMITLKEKLENNTLLAEIHDVVYDVPPQVYVPASDDETFPTDQVYVPDESDSADPVRPGSSGSARPAGSYRTTAEEEAEAYANAVDEPNPPKPEPYVPARPSPGLTPEEEAFFATMKSADRAYYRATGTANDEWNPPVSDAPPPEWYGPAVGPESPAAAGPGSSDPVQPGASDPAETPDRQVCASTANPSDVVSHLEKPADLCQPPVADSERKTSELSGTPPDVKTAASQTGWHSVPTSAGHAGREVPGPKEEATLRSGVSEGPQDPRQQEAERRRAEDKRRLDANPLWMPPDTAGLPPHREIRVKLEWYQRVYEGDPHLRGSTARFIEQAYQDYEEAVKEVPVEDLTEYDLELLEAPDILFGNSSS